jgi:riboflavin biosynthesis pyrimidine reductase
MMAASVAGTAAAIRALYGDDLVDAGGVLHVAAVWAGPGGRLFNMRIGERTPASRTDAFALAVARARAEAILTTGRILREEPGLRFDAHADAGLRAWRRTRLGLDAPPIVVVLTREASFDMRHPALVGQTTWIVTGHAVAAAGARRTGAADRPRLAWVGRDAPGLLDALSLLRERGLSRVLVEAGPSTSGALYETPGRVDELLLSICRAPLLPEGVRGASFPSAEALRAAGLVEVARAERTEESGPWVFTRWRRR